MGGTLRRVWGVRQGLHAQQDAPRTTFCSGTRHRESRSLLHQEPMAGHGHWGYPPPAAWEAPSPSPKGPAAPGTCFQKSLSCGKNRTASNSGQCQLLALALAEGPRLAGWPGQWASQVSRGGHPGPWQGREGAGGGRGGSTQVDFQGMCSLWGGGRRAPEHRCPDLEEWVLHFQRAGAAPPPPPPLPSQRKAPALPESSHHGASSPQSSRPQRHHWCPPRTHWLLLPPKLPLPLCSALPTHPQPQPCRNRLPSAAPE